MASETEIAWAAGFFDGEGHVGVHLHNQKAPCNGRKCKYYRLTVSISNTDLLSVNHFGDIVGVKGSTYASKPGDDTIGGARRKQICYQTRWYARKAADVMEVLLPHLVTKHRQAELAIAFRKMMKPCKGNRVPQSEVDRRGDIANEMHALRFPHVA